MDQKKLFALLQLTDSAFPIGGFSHSLGLEAYTQHCGTSRKQMEPEVLHHALICIIENSGSLSVPFVREAYNVVMAASTAECDESDDTSAENGLEMNYEISGDTENKNGAELSDKRQSDIIQRLVRLDRLYEACTANHIARRASTRQGRSLLEATLHTFPNLEQQGMDQLNAVLPHCHYAVLHGAILGCLGLTLEDAISSFMFGVVRTLVATAVRLDVLGAMEGQKLQWKLQELCTDVIRRNTSRPVQQACIKFPVLDILQNTQDTLFAKLFYS